MIATVPTTIHPSPESALRSIVRAQFWRAAHRVTPRTWEAMKRITDVGLSVVGLIITLPICVLIAIAIKLVSPGPVLFVQERVGRHGRSFRLYKFRTMVDGAHLLHQHVSHLNACDGPALKIPNDPRMHPLGAFLRRSSLDELPQLLNVLKGEMSLVGPRPALAREVETYLPHYHQRLTVQPGITGLWQVSGRANVQFRRWMAMDVWYARHWTPVVDAWILARTLPAVLKRDGAW